VTETKNSPLPQVETHHATEDSLVSEIFNGDEIIRESFASRTAHHAANEMERRFLFAALGKEVNNGGSPRVLYERSRDAEHQDVVILTVPSGDTAIVKA
jgi:hypothetical protein